METPRIWQLGQVSQVGFVVADVEKAAREWVRLTGAGPFFVGSFRMDDCFYRGRTVSMDITTALAYLGDTQIQLVQPNGDGPNIFSELLAQTSNPGGVFHHIHLLTDDVAREIARFRAQEVEMVSYSEVAGVLKVAIFDTIATLGGLLQYYQFNPSSQRQFKIVHDIHLNWDGKDPIRRNLRETLGH